MESSAAVASIRSYLKDILGSDSVFSDDIILSYIRKFSGRIDAVQCALDSLLEDYYKAPQGYNSAPINIPQGAYYSAPQGAYYSAPQGAYYSAPPGYFYAPPGYYNVPQEYQQDAPMNSGAGGSSSVSDSFREFCKLPFFKKVCTL